MRNQTISAAYGIGAVLATLLSFALGQAASAEDGPAIQPKSVPVAFIPPPIKAPEKSVPEEVEPTDLRGRLEAAGLTVEATWCLDATRTLDGGLHPRRTTHRSFFDLDFTFDTEPLLRLPGGKLRLELWRIGGDSRADGSGAIQDPSGLTSERRAEMGQVWYEQAFKTPALRVRLGKIDPTGDFAVVEGGGDFLNTGVLYSPNFLGVPVYPDPAFGGEAFWAPDPALSFAVGVFDGAAQEGVPTGKRGPSTLFGSPSDLCALAEVRTRWTLGAGELPGTAVLGGWHHDGKFGTLDGSDENGTGGAYLVTEQTLLRESPDNPDDVQGLSVFARTTLAERDVAEVRRHDGAGAVWTGLFDGRDADTTGFAVLRAQSAAALHHRSETVVELFHKFQITESISVTPDLQYVRHPWGAPQRSGALVVGLRLVMVF